MGLIRTVIRGVIVAKVIQFIRNRASGSGGRSR